MLLNDATSAPAVHSKKTTLKWFKMNGFGRNNNRINILAK